MFDYFNYFNGTGVYNPFINYSWSQTLTVGNNQQIKDTGKSGLNLQQYFGQGVYFNGVDQNIVLETVAPIETNSIWTICFSVNTAINTKYIVRTIGGTLKVLWFNNGLTYYNGSANIKLDTTNVNRAGSYIITSNGAYIYTYLNNVLISTISQTVEQLSYGLVRDLAGNTGGNYYQGVLKDVYHFKRAFSVSDVDKYNNQPNQFFMDSLEDSSCILSMPMCENDGYVRNYKSYSGGSNLIVNGTFDTDTSGWGGFSNGILSLVSNQLKIESPAGDTAGAASQILTHTFIAGKFYMMEYEASSTTAVSTGIRITSSEGTFGDILSEPYVYRGTKTKVSTAFLCTKTTSSAQLALYATGSGMGGLGAYAMYDNVSLKEISGVYPINNYTAPSRTSAQKLPYGLQTSGFKRNSLGVILSKSNFLEADGVGYGNTGWIPMLNEDFTVEAVFEVTNDSPFRLNGSSYTNGVYFGKNSGGKNLYVRVFNSPVFQLPNTEYFVCLSFSYNRQTKEVKQYINGILFTTQLATSTSSSALPVLLGMTSKTGEYPVIKPTRLFKVHQKVLTQEEVTKNFNIYTAQGLLSESGESISALVQ